MPNENAPQKPATAPRRAATFRLAPESHELLNEWVAAHPAPPSKTAAIELAIRLLWEHHDPYRQGG